MLHCSTFKMSVECEESARFRAVDSFRGIGQSSPVILYAKGDQYTARTNMTVDRVYNVYRIKIRFDTTTKFSKMASNRRLE